MHKTFRAFIRSLGPLLIISLRSAIAEVLSQLSLKVGVHPPDRTNYTDRDELPPVPSSPTPEDGSQPINSELPWTSQAPTGGTQRKQKKSDDSPEYLDSAE